MIPKANPDDLFGRFREVIADPINLLIERVAEAGLTQGNEVVLHNGNRVPVTGNYAYYGNFSHLLVLNRGVHEPLEEYVFQETMSRMSDAPLMIELGAYWGHYSMWLKKLRPRSTVILVEPDANCLATGKHNFQRNGFTGEFVQAFVGTGGFEIDPFIESRGIVHIDILHVDIQSYELEMMKGALRTLENAKVDYAFVSTHSQALHHEIIRNFECLGYRVEVRSDFENETTSFDGFVFASSPRVPQIFSNFYALGRNRIVESTSSELFASLAGIQRAAQLG